MKFYLFTLILFSNLSYASVGRIVFQKGKVNVYRDGKKLKLKKSFPIETKDKITTGPNSLAIIKIGTVATVKLNDNSEYNVKSDISHKLQRGSAFFNVIRKNLRDKINKKKRRNFKVQARSVAMGVRGTTFFVSHDEKENVWMCVKEGQVEIKGKEDKKPVLVNGGEGVKVEKGEETSDPKPLKWTEKLNWNTDPEKGKLENDASIEKAYSDLENLDYD